MSVDAKARKRAASTHLFRWVHPFGRGRGFANSDDAAIFFAASFFWALCCFRRAPHLCGIPSDDVPRCRSLAVGPADGEADGLRIRARPHGGTIFSPIVTARRTIEPIGRARWATSLSPSTNRLIKKPLKRPEIISNDRGHENELVSCLDVTSGVFWAHYPLFFDHRRAARAHSKPEREASLTRQSSDAPGNRSVKTVPETKPLSTEMVPR